MILIFGKTGQVARELQRLAPDALFLSRQEADLTQPEACAAAIAQHRPKAVINAAAYTAVDRAETEEPLAEIINAKAPDAMARACKALSIPLVHISTDYVFDGQGEAPFTPDHPSAPLGAYGRTKRKGEEAILKAQIPFAILRTSWVFSAHGANFVKTMLRLGSERASLSVVNDQIGGPTPASAIAKAALTMAEPLIHAPEKSGIYHISGEPDLSWADFARAIMATAALPCEIIDIPSAAYPTPAKRPKNSRLNCDTLSTFGLSRPDWRQALSDVIHELKGTP